jgi:hypothetical protein
MVQFNNIKLFLLFVLVTTTQLSTAHPLGMTVTNMNYSKGNLLFSSRIFYDDFYYEFQETASVKNKNFKKNGIDKNDKKDLVKYFEKNIQIWINNKALKQNAIKFMLEKHDEDAYIFIVELSYKAIINKGSKVKIRNTVLLNSIGGQKHLINVFLSDTNAPTHGLITLDKENPEYEFVNE